MSDASPGPARNRRPGTLKVGTIAGSDVLVTSSWFLIAVLIAVAVRPRVEQVSPDLGTVATFIAGLTFAVLLYGSILLHEASHALMARHFGLPVGDIVLHFLGGATTIEAEPRRPREEFWIAVVGPLTSIAVGLVALAGLTTEPDGLIRMAVEGLAGANLVVGVLNLVPGLPLDGGRVLRAGVWRLTGNLHRGTIVAGWGGRICAVLVVAWPLLMPTVVDQQPSVFTVVMAVVVAIFLWAGATAAMSSARMRARLPSLVAADLARRTLAVPADLPLAEAVRRAQEAGAGAIITTTSDGRPLGLVNESSVQATPADRRPWVPTSSVARTLVDGLSLPVGIQGEELILAITRMPAPEYLLVDSSGAVVGVLATHDVDAAFRSGGK
ncbi:MAG: site-2 protease family protein [Nocardioides sp.]